MAKLTVDMDSTAQVPGKSAKRGDRSAPDGSTAAFGQGTAAAEQKRQDDKWAEAQANSVFGSVDSSADFGPDYSRRRIRFHKSDEVNPYAAEQDRRYGLDERLRKIIILAVITVAVFFLVCILPTNVFNFAARTDSSIGGYASEIAASFQGFIMFFIDSDTMYGTYVFTVLVTLLAGAAMGLSGGVFQGAMKNALASPSTLGVTSGGTIGIIIYAVFVAPGTVGATFQGQIGDYQALVDQMEIGQYIVEMFGSFLCSLVGCAAVVFMVMSIALIAGRGKVSNASLVIAGQVFTAAIGVVITWVRTYLTEHGDATAVLVLQSAQSSTFTGAYNLMSVAVFAIPLIACMVVIVLMAPRLTLLAFNEDEARSMGISIAATRNFMVAICTVLTALVVSFCGVVGFVGFMVPHIARKYIGPDFRFLLPACALMGAIMVCATFYLSEMGIPYLSSGSTGMITSLVGCIAFIVMAIRNRGAASGDWV